VFVLQAWDQLDEKLGFPKFSQGPPQQGWLVNMKEVRRAWALSLENRVSEQPELIALRDDFFFLSVVDSRNR
jgi:hypothetical protein